MLVDVHTHLDFPQFDSDRGEVIKKASEEGILIITSGLGPEGIERVIKLSEKHEGILATLGLSPQEFDHDVIDETIKLIRKYKELEYIDSVEIIMMTSSPDEVRSLKNFGEKVMRTIEALSKMTEELSFDCPTCDYQDICNDVGELQAMRKKLKRGSEV